MISALANPETLRPSKILVNKRPIRGLESSFLSSLPPVKNKDQACEALIVLKLLKSGLKTTEPNSSGDLKSKLLFM